MSSFFFDILNYFVQLFRKLMFSNICQYGGYIKYIKLHLLRFYRMLLVQLRTINNVDTGAKVQVPIFIDQGERVKIDTRSGTYVSRAGK